MTPPPHPSTATPDETPVFVDPSGRRLRRVRWLTWSVFAAVAAYLVLVLSPFLGGPSIGSAFLPAPQQQDSPHAAPSRPSEQSAPGPARPAESTLASERADVPNRVGTIPIGSTATGTPAPTRTTPPATTAPAPTSSNGPTTAPTASSTDPGKSQSAPGQTRRPTRPPKP
ncbi:hypothetical protein [Intrasporangium chromatireducens]|nr:hypothetical protein [Intrasporangium chromatireducens]